MNLKNIFNPSLTWVKNLFTPDFVRDVPVRILFVMAAILVLIIWLVAIFMFQKTSYPVPLRYNSFLGVTELGPWFKLYRLPLFNLIILIINSFLANSVFKKDRMIAYIFLGASVFVGIMSLSVIINLSILINR